MFCFDLNSLKASKGFKKLIVVNFTLVDLDSENHYYQRTSLSPVY